MSRSLPEPWLRGPIAGAHPAVQAVLYSFQHAREDLAKWTEMLTDEQLWAGPAGVMSAGSQIRHIGGSIDRLCTYLQDRALSAGQLRELEAEMGPVSRKELFREFEAVLDRAEELLRGLDPATFEDARTVGRQRLPSTVIGLLVHMAEHTQRHVGQAIVTAKVARSLSGSS